MPIFPVVNAIADAQFIFDAGIAHQLVQADGKIKEKIIVAAVKEPLNRTQLLLGLLVSLFNESQGRVLLYSLADIVAFVLFLTRTHVVVLIVKPCAHSIAAAELIGVTLAINSTAATAH